MSDVIKFNLRITWKAPVYVRIDQELCEKVRSPEAALDNLNHRWPEQQSQEYQAAKRMCLSALSNRADEEAARQAFIDAAARAKMLA